MSIAKKKFSILFVSVFVGFFHFLMVVVCSLGTAADIDCGPQSINSTDTGRIECGQELGPGGSFILDRDLDCKRQCFGLIVIGPAVLGGFPALVCHLYQDQPLRGHGYHRANKRSC